MDNVPDCGSIALCNDLGSAPCPLSLPLYGFPGERETLQHWHGRILCL